MHKSGILDSCASALQDHPVFIDLFLSAFFLSKLQAFDSVRNDSSLGPSDHTGRSTVAVLQHNIRVLTGSPCHHNVLLERMHIASSNEKHRAQSSVGTGGLCDYPVIVNESFPATRFIIIASSFPPFLPLRGNLSLTPPISWLHLWSVPARDLVFPPPLLVCGRGRCLLAIINNEGLMKARMRGGSPKQLLHPRRCANPRGCLAAEPSRCSRWNQINLSADGGERDELSFPERWINNKTFGEWDEARQSAFESSSGHLHPRITSN